VLALLGLAGRHPRSAVLAESCSRIHTQTFITTTFTGDKLKDLMREGRIKYLQPALVGIDFCVLHRLEK